MRFPRVACSRGGLGGPGRSGCPLAAGADARVCANADVGGGGRALGAPRVSAASPIDECDRGSAGQLNA